MPRPMHNDPVADVRALLADFYRCPAMGNGSIVAGCEGLGERCGASGKVPAGLRAAGFAPPRAGFAIIGLGFGNFPGLPFANGAKVPATGLPNEIAASTLMGKPPASEGNVNGLPLLEIESVKPVEKTI